MQSKETVQVLLGLISVWNVSFLRCPARVSASARFYQDSSFNTRLPDANHVSSRLKDMRRPCDFCRRLQAILPYSQALQKLAPHIQQVTRYSITFLDTIQSFEVISEGKWKVRDYMVFLTFTA